MRIAMAIMSGRCIRRAGGVHHLHIKACPSGMREGVAVPSPRLEQLPPNFYLELAGRRDNFKDTLLWATWA